MTQKFHFIVRVLINEKETFQAVVGLILFLYFKSKKYTLTALQKNGLSTLVIIVFLQFTLGVLTLLFGVPMWLGLTHQVMAFLLLATMTFTLHRLSK